MKTMSGAVVYMPYELHLKAGRNCKNPLRIWSHDSGYRGEIHAIISNVSTLTQSLYKNTRVGQIVITPVVIADFVLDLGESRDTGAFGSSGI